MINVDRTTTLQVQNCLRRNLGDKLDIFATTNGFVFTNKKYGGTVILSLGELPEWFPKLFTNDKMEGDWDMDHPDILKGTIR